MDIVTKNSFKTLMCAFQMRTLANIIELPNFCERIAKMMKVEVKQSVL